MTASNIVGYSLIAAGCVVALLALIPKHFRRTPLFSGAERFERRNGRCPGQPEKEKWYERPNVVIGISMIIVGVMIMVICGNNAIAWPLG